ncbi:HMBOX protein [Trichostrongylus colubriformis]|uniref:HMBOX protein n=1 Tax=Trichostrongylus colubriformis TaxID=6319 RepID=A0AAN8FQM7_TRICO
MILFTVEQLELIRRLRSTGISPAQVAEAFRQLEQVDNSLDQPPPPPPPPAQPSSLLSSLMTTIDAQQPQPDSPSPMLLQALQAQPPVPVTISASPPEVSTSPERLSVQTVPAASAASEPTTSRTPDASINVSEAAAIPCTAPPATLPRYENNAGGRPIRSLRTPMKEITTLDRPEELDEFMEQGEEACIADMKQFITQYSLRQTTVAMMTGVSQPYISKLLNGNHRELSLRCRKNIYCWYLNCRRHPHKLSVFFADPATRLETNGDGELVPQRRERYVFRPILIKILEGFFTQSPFPDLNKRVEIATACNQVLQIEKRGVGLMPKEVVSPQVVANWFANKRKELRRRSQEANEQAAAVAGSATSSQPHTPGHTGTEEATSSGVGSTPSPVMEEAETMDQTDVETRPLDVMTLAARLGIAFPQLAAATATTIADSSSVDTTYSQTLPIATLASHLLAASQNFAAPFGSGASDGTGGETQATTGATAAGAAEQLTMATLASQLLPTTTPSTLSLIAPGLQMLNNQLPVLNELCKTEQQQLDTATEHNLLSMTYDQLHPSAPLLKTEPME